MTALRFLATVLIVTFGVATTNSQAAGPTLVFDSVTGDVLLEDRAGELWYPASLTKLMTAYLVFQKLKAGTLSLDQPLVVSRVARLQPPSRIDLEPGTTISLDLAVQSMLVYSANDMAYALAENASDSIETFVAEMNAEARKLGMTGTHFVNPNGFFDPRQITTARDMAILAAAILREFPDRAHYFAQAEVTIGKRKLVSRNLFLRQMDGADGMKTGYVCNSAFNLIATATIDSRKLGVVVFGARSGKQRADMAEALLVDAFTTKGSKTGTHVKQIKNMSLGTVVPSDLTASVCPQKTPVRIVSARELDGWGITFGTYTSANKADMALRGRILGASGRELPGPTGVIRMPNNAGFAAVVWRLTREQSQSACAGYQREAAPCAIFTPEDFARISALTPDSPPKPRLKPSTRPPSR